LQQYSFKAKSNLKTNISSNIPADVVLDSRGLSEAELQEYCKHRKGCWMLAAIALQVRMEKQLAPNES
jgi:hypothetical protein